MLEPEIRLWRAFLDRHIADVFIDTQSVSPEEREASKEWLYDRQSSFHPDFFEVCDLARVEPDWVEFVIRKLEGGYGRGDASRAEGEGAGTS